MPGKRERNHGLTERGREELRSSVPYLVTLLAAGVFAFTSGGYILGRSSPVAIVYLLIAAAWVWLLRRPGRPPLVFLLGLAVFGVFVAWSGLSVLWSIGPDLSWEAFNLAAFYLAVVLIVAFTPTRLLQLRVAAAGYLVVAVAVAVYAYLGKLTPDVVTHAQIEIRLASPIGYYNVLALMMVLGLAVALALAGDRALKPWWRILAAGAGVPLALTFFFAFSRGGWVALAVVLAVYFVLSATRLTSLATLAAIAAPVAFVLWRLRDLETVFANVKGATLAQRVEQGHTLLVWSLLALVVTLAAEALIVLVQRTVPLPGRVRLAVGAAVALVVVGGLAGGAYSFVQGQGGTAWLRERASAFVNDSDTAIGGDRAGRLLTANNGRVPTWREALAQSEVTRLSGTGSGTFPLTHYRFREFGGIVKHSHSEYLDVLSEVGVVGLAIFVAAVVLLLAGALDLPWRYRADPGRSLLAALQAGTIGFFVHIAVDWDWDMAAIGTVVFLFLGACAAYLGTRRAAERAAAQAAAGAAARAAEAGAPAIVAVPAGTAELAAAGPGGHLGWPELPARSGAPGSPAESADWFRWPGPSPEAEAAVSPAAEDSEGPAGEPRPAPADEPRPHRSHRHHRSWWTRWERPLRLAASAALLLLALSWALPYLSGRARDAAIAASAAGDPAAALVQAQQAAQLNPLAADPLITQAQLLQQLGRDREALAALEAAKRLQPDNFKVYEQLGRLYLTAFDRRKDALAAFRRGLALNPLDRELRAEFEEAAAARSGSR